MTSLVNRLAQQVIDQDQIDYWNFADFSMIGRIRFGIRYADSDALISAEMVVKDLSAVGLRQLLKYAPEEISNEWSDRARLTKTSNPEEFAVTMVVHEIWRRTENTVPILNR